LGDKQPLDSDAVSHSICTECERHFSKQWAGLKLGEYLDDFDLPAMALNEEGRVVAANQRMAEILGKKDRIRCGLLGGEAMECQFARLPEGCGRTVHCQTCTIRRTVMAVIDTGQPQLRVPAYLDQSDRRIRLVISAYERQGFAQIVIHEINGDP
jgi:hypothetical protein